MESFDEFGNKIESKDENISEIRSYEYKFNKCTVKNYDFFRQIANIRERVLNVGVIGGIKSGKSSLIKYFGNFTNFDVEKIICDENDKFDLKTFNFCGKTIHSEYESQRDTTIHYKPITFLLQNTKEMSVIVNFIDTSSHIEFYRETQEIIPYFHSTVLILDISEDISLICRLYLKNISNKNTILVLNKLDKLIIELNMPLSVIFEKIEYLRSKIKTENIFITSLVRNIIFKYNEDILASFYEAFIDKQRIQKNSKIIKIIKSLKISNFEIIDELFKIKKNNIECKEMYIKKHYRVENMILPLYFPNLNSYTQINTDNSIDLDIKNNNQKSNKTLDQKFSITQSKSGSLENKIFINNNEYKVIKKFLILKNGVVEVDFFTKDLPYLVYLDKEIKEESNGSNEENIISVIVENASAMKILKKLYPSINIRENIISGPSELFLDSVFCDINKMGINCKIIYIFNKFKETIKSKKICITAKFSIYIEPISDNKNICFDFENNKLIMTKETIYNHFLNSLNESDNNIESNKCQDKINLKSCDLTSNINEENKKDKIRLQTYKGNNLYYEIKNTDKVITQASKNLSKLFKNFINQGPIVFQEVFGVNISVNFSKNNSKTGIYFQKECKKLFRSDFKILEPIFYIEILIQKHHLNFIKSFITSQKGKINDTFDVPYTEYNIIRGEISAFNAFGLEAYIKNTAFCHIEKIIIGYSEVPYGFEEHKKLNDFL
ncbi:hypothetical protein LUQ84_000957 [Hamiltosporidium tvaerminnensis]|nr:hypothetical protein LUQ84_000957 [Hamiltosporidium tvaerminnensis]